MRFVIYCPAISIAKSAFGIIADKIAGNVADGAEIIINRSARGTLNRISAFTLNIIADKITGDVADGTIVINRPARGIVTTLGIIFDKIAGDVTDTAVIVNRAAITFSIP